MTATNHILTGALIGTLVKNPYLALPLALLSHYVLDVLPHFGIKDRERLVIRGALIADTVLVVVVLAALLLSGIPQAPFLIACGIVAASPDLLWLPHVIAELRGKMKQLGWYSRIALNIQWGEYPWGMAVEVVWGAAMAILLIKLI